MAITPAELVFRDYVTDGVPGSGANKPAKAEVRAWGQSLQYTNVITPTALAADQNDYAPTGNAAANIWRLSTTASATRYVGGISGGSQGRFIILQNVNAVGTGNIIIPAQNTGSAAANRIVSEVVIKPGDARRFTYDAIAGRWVAEGSLTSDIPMIVRDEKPTNTAGGTFTASGSFINRTLNIIVSGGFSGASLSSDTIILPAGSYHAEWSAPAAAVAGHITQLFNQSDSVVIGTGESAYTSNTDATVMTVSRGSANFTITSAKGITLQHRCTVTRATDGRGIAANCGLMEVYSVVTIRKTG